VPPRHKNTKFFPRLRLPVCRRQVKKALRRFYYERLNYVRSLGKNLVIVKNNLKKSEKKYKKVVYKLKTV